MQPWQTLRGRRRGLAVTLRGGRDGGTREGGSQSPRPSPPAVAARPASLARVPGASRGIAPSQGTPRHDVVLNDAASLCYTEGRSANLAGARVGYSIEVSSNLRTRQSVTTSCGRRYVATATSDVITRLRSAAKISVAPT